MVSLGNVVVRILGLAGTVSTAFFVAYPIFLRVSNFMEESSEWSLSVVDAETVQFPSVSVCNVNHLHPSILGQIDDVLNEFLYEFPRIQETNFTLDYREYHENVAIFDAANDTDRTRATYESRYGLVGYLGKSKASGIGIHLEDFVVDCKIKNTPCDISESFTTYFDPYYFNCFTYNLQGGFPSMLHGSTLYGLNLDLFLGAAGMYDNADWPGVNDTGIPGESNPGVKVMIHPPNTRPFPSADSFDIPARESATFGVKLSAVNRKPDSCIENTEDEFAYSETACRVHCLQEHIIAECGCLDTRLGSTSLLGGSDHPHCYKLPDLNAANCTDIVSFQCTALVADWNVRMACLERVSVEHESVSCKCPPPCHDVSYDISYSTASLPEKPSEALNAHLEWMPADESVILKDMYGGNLGNLVSRIKVYISDGHVTTVDEVDAYSDDDLIADMGIQFALLISMVTAGFVKLSTYFTN